MGRPRTRVVALACGLVVSGAVLGACTAPEEVGSADVPASPVAAPPTPPPSRVTGPCGMPVPDADGTFQARATGGSVAAMLFGPLPAQAGTDLKVVWRVTGTGDLQVTAYRPDGSTAPLAFGPEGHGGSTFHRPGDEWGTGFRFDAPGCWRIDLRRGEVSASVPIEVRPAA